MSIKTGKSDTSINPFFPFFPGIYDPLFFHALHKFVRAAFADSKHAGCVFFAETGFWESGKQSLFVETVQGSRISRSAFSHALKIRGMPVPNASIMFKRQKTCASFSFRVTETPLSIKSCVTPGITPPRDMNSSRSSIYHLFLPGSRRKR